jgi:UDP-N-acetylglucosamine 2-epimerase (non-hydrolysing)
VTHPNPALSASVRRRLANTPAVRVVPTLAYPHMLGLLSVADLVITDSGGLQEEAATMGIPVVVTREQTERPEAIIPGYGELAGTDPARILASAMAFLDSALPPHGRSPFGDGFAGERAASAIARFLGAGVADEPIGTAVDHAGFDRACPIRCALNCANAATSACA